MTTLFGVVTLGAATLALLTAVQGLASP